MHLFMRVPFLLIAALVFLASAAAALAFPPPASQTFTITSSSGPAVPPAAAAAGFTTLALNMDFTTSAAVSGWSNAPLFNAQNISNWLDCSGSSLMWHLGGAGQGNNAPCPASWSIVTDGGTSALLLSYSDDQSFSTVKSIPNEFYVEFRMRTDSQSLTNCNGSVCQDVWSYSNAGIPGGDIFEWDFDEQGQNTYNAYAGGGLNFNDPGGPGEGHQWFSIPSWDPFNYHTLGLLVTQDGAGNIAGCYYYDNTQYYITTSATNGSRVNNCVVIDASSYLTSLQTPLTVIFWNAWTQAGGPVIGTVNTWYQFLRVWACPNWATAQNGSTSGWVCAGSIYTGP
jgi:hypothetical protein